jgi:hypothetical protein
MTESNLYEYTISSERRAESFLSDSAIVPRVTDIYPHEYKVGKMVEQPHALFIKGHELTQQEFNFSIWKQYPQAVSLPPMGNKGWKEGTVVDQLGYATIKFCRGSPAYMVVGSNLRGGGGFPPNLGVQLSGLRLSKSTFIAVLVTNFLEILGPPLPHATPALAMNDPQSGHPWRKDLCRPP